MGKKFKLIHINDFFVVAQSIIFSHDGNWFHC